MLVKFRTDSKRLDEPFTFRVQLKVASNKETGTDDKECVQLPGEMIEKFTQLSPRALIFARLLLNCQSYWIPLSTACKNREQKSGSLYCNGRRSSPLRVPKPAKPTTKRY